MVNTPHKHPVPPNARTIASYRRSSPVLIARLEDAITNYRIPDADGEPSVWFHEHFLGDEMTRLVDNIICIPNERDGECSLREVDKVVDTVLCGYDTEEQFIGLSEAICEVMNHICNKPGCALCYETMGG